MDEIFSLPDELSNIACRLHRLLPIVCAVCCLLSSVVVTTIFRLLPAFVCTVCYLLLVFRLLPAVVCTVCYLLLVFVCCLHSSAPSVTCCLFSSVAYCMLPLLCIVSWNLFTYTYCHVIYRRSFKIRPKKYFVSSEVS